MSALEHAAANNAVRDARLAAFSRVFTTDADEAAAEIGRIFCPHRLDPQDRSWPDFHALHNSAGFDGFSINYVAYGGSVAIDPGCLDRFFLLQIPLRGSARIKTASRRIDSSPGRKASLLSPTIPTQMVWQDNCAQLILLIDRQQMEKRAAALAEKPVMPVEFEPEIDLTGSFGRALQFHLEYMADIAESSEPGKPISPVTAATLRESILGLLLTGQKHSLTEAIARRTNGTTILPGLLRKARARLEEHATAPLDLDRLAQSCGVSVRTLQSGFRRHFGASVSETLLEIRLTHLRQKLRDAEPGARITDIAFDLGFTHLSRMAQVYRGKFGETPSQTMRRGK